MKNQQRPPILANEALNQAFVQNGYVVLPNFFSKTEIDVLQQKYNELHPAQHQAMWASNFSPDEAYRKAINDFLVDFWKNKDVSPLAPHTLFSGVFLIKGLGENSQSLVHQDWTVTNEQSFDSWSIWTSLVDITPQNGPLYVIKGSHRFFDFPRPALAPWPYYEFYNEWEKYFEYLYPKAGDAVLFNHRLIHGSPRNETDRERIAVNFGLASAGATYQFTYLNPETQQIEVYEIEQAFSYQHSYGGQPKSGRLVSQTPFQFPKIDSATIAKLVSGELFALPNNFVAESLQRPAEPALGGGLLGFLKRFWQKQ